MRRTSSTSASNWAVEIVVMSGAKTECGGLAYRNAGPYVQCMKTLTCSAPQLQHSRAGNDAQSARW